MRSLLPICLLVPASVLLLSTCSTTNTSPAVSMAAQTGGGESADGILGFGFLELIPGQWHGPVTTTTPAGSFDDWYVDYRPISASQIGQYSTLDQDTVNYISFFVVELQGQLRIAMRTEGVFRNQGCVTYELLDIADEQRGYYRFSDFKAGIDRAYTEFVFQGDTLTMDTYTNKFNQVSPLEVHSRWTATLGSRDAARPATDEFDYPRPIPVRDFTDAFTHMSESIFFTFENDPYPTDEQPYLGQVNVEISIDDSLAVETDDEIFLLLCTQPLFDGLVYLPENWKYFSRYVFLPPDTRTYTFTSVHPGTYYIYSYNDTNGDRHHLSGDYMSSRLQHSFVVPPEGSANVETTIDFVLP